MRMLIVLIWIFFPLPMVTLFATDNVNTSKKGFFFFFPFVFFIQSVKGFTFTEKLFLCSYVRGYGQWWIWRHYEHWHFLYGYWNDEKEIQVSSSDEMYPFGYDRILIFLGKPPCLYFFVFVWFSFHFIFSPLQVAITLSVVSLMNLNRHANGC